MSKFYTNLKVSNITTGNKAVVTTNNGTLKESNISDSETAKVSILNNSGLGANFLADDGFYKVPVTVINDLTTGGINNALSAEQGIGISNRLDALEGDVSNINSQLTNILGN